MSNSKLSSWQVPPALAFDNTRNAYPNESSVVGWVDEQNQDGLAWHKAQRTHIDYAKAFEIFASRFDPSEIAAYRSKLTTGRLRRNTREVIGACANIRPIWGYTSDNATYQDNAMMMNKITRAVYLERFADRAIKQALQWSSVTNTGFIRPVYRRDKYGWGKGNLTFFTYGAPSILPAQLPSNNDWQEAYAVSIMDELPIAMAHGMFPRFQERLQPTESKYWHSPEIRSAAKGNMFQRIWGRRKNKDGYQNAETYCPIRYTYVIDLQVNTTDNMIPMGQPNTSWYYEVPALGKPKPDGTIADANAALMYPYRRLIISSEDVLLYDGPSFDWHGDLPLIDFCLDDWVWEPLGFGAVRDGYDLNIAMDEIDRGNMDKLRSRLDISLGYDINAVTKNEADSFDPMQPRGRIGFDGTVSDVPFKPVIPPDVLQIDPESLAIRQIFADTMDYQMALKDMLALAKARAGGGVDDGLEQVMQASGPIVRDISRNVERSLTVMGNQVKYIIIQWYDTRRVMNYVGPDGVTKETIDFDPNSLVPSHMPNELGPSATGIEVPGSKYTRIQRARWFADNLHMNILPHSIHEITQMAHKLGLIQLRKAGVQIDSRTIAESWDLQNFGTEPKGNTIWERYWNEQEQVAQHAIKVKQVVDQIMQQGVAPTPAMEGALGSTPAVPAMEGRPPSGQESPRLVQKDGGARSTISESGS